MKTTCKPSFLLKQRPWLSALMILAYAGQLFAPVLCAAGPITADPNAGANRPVIDGSANGVPVINIARPDDRGLSHNKYQDFNVPRQGAILNNAGTETNTQLAGWIDRNSNFNPNDSARLILNEVTGANASRLLGHLEVAGRRADVIIANPNGIYGANFGFINTSRAMLVTGRPEFDETGNLRSFAIRGGKVVIDGSGEGEHPGLGVHASLADQFDILARAVEINAQVFAKKINVVTGANRVDYATLDTEKIAANPNEAAPLVALDIAALGGMYANRIRLVGTEAGLGVNTRGDIAAGIDGFTLTSEGRVVMNGKTLSDGVIDIRAREGIASDGTLHAAGNTTLATQGAIKNTGLLASQKDVVLTADGSIKNSGVLAAGLDAGGGFTDTNAGITAIAGADLDATDGQHYAGQNITFTADSLDLARATTQASAVFITARSGDVIHSGAKLGADVFAVSLPGRFDNSAGLINASGITVAAGSFANNDSGVIAHAGGDALTFDIAGAFANTGGTISSLGRLALSSGSLDNTAGCIAALGDATIVTRNGLDNTGGELLGEGNLAITNIAGALANRSGAIQSGGILAIRNASGILDNTGGGILASGSLALLAGTLANARGLIASTNDIAINAASLDNTSGTIDANGTLTATLPGALDNTGGQLIARAGRLALDAAGLDNSDGFIATGASLDLDLADALENTGGIITAAGDLTVRAARLSSTGELSSTAGSASLTARSGNIANTGIIYASGSLALAAGLGAVSNTGAHATLGAGASLSLTALRLDNTAAHISASENIRITLADSSATLLNDNALISAGNDLHIATPGGLSNSDGGITATHGDLTLTAAGTVINTGLHARIASGGALALATVGRLDNTGGAIFSESALSITTGAASVVNQSGYIGVTGTRQTAALVLNTGAFDNTGGVLASTGSLALNAASLNNASEGIITAGGAADITLAGSFANTGDAQVFSGGKITLAAAAVDNRHGIIKGVSGIAAAISGGWLNGDSGILVAGGQGIGITAASFDNGTGVMRSTGGITLGIAGNLANTGGEIVTDAAASIIAATFDNTLGLVSANDTLALSATGGNLDNRLGSLSAGSSAVIAVRDDLLNASGAIMAGGAVLSARNLDNTAGWIGSAGAADITIAGVFENRDAGTVAAGKNLRITAGDIVNADSGAAGGILGNAGIALVATNGALDNTAGRINALGDASVTLFAGLLNAGGILSTDGALAIDARDFDNTAGGYLAAGAGLSAVLTGALDNDAGIIISLGESSLAAERITNSGGGCIHSDKSLSLISSNGVGNSAGTVRSLENISISTGSASLDNASGVLQAFGNLSILNTAGGILDNAAGTITAGGTLAIASLNALLDNTSGLIATGADGSAIIETGALASAGGSIIAGRDLSIDIANGGLVLDGSQEIWANNDLALTLRDGAFANLGSGLLAFGLATINASGGITNHAGAVLNAGELSLVTTGTITNLGRIDADRISAHAGHLVNRSVIMGGGITLDAGRIDNTGAGALVAGRYDIGLFADELCNTRDIGAGPAITGANIYAGGDLVIAGRGGLDASGNPVAQARRILNSSSSIEARGGATLSALEIINEKDVFETAEVEIARVEIGHWHGDTRDYELYRKYLDPDGDNNHWLAYTRVTWETRMTADSPEARILAGGSLNFGGSHYLGNAYGTIAAGGNIDMGGVTYAAAETQFNRTEKYSDVRVEFREKDFWGNWKYKTGSSITLGDEVTLLSKAGASLVANGTIHGSDVTIHNGDRTLHTNADTGFGGAAINPNAGAGTIAGHDATDTSGDTNGAGNDHGADGRDTTLPPVTPPAGDGSDGRLSGEKTLPTLVITAPGEVNFTTPQNPLYSVVTDPKQPYLVVTDPRFTNWNNYISSDYFFERMGVDPQAMHKRLGDGFYEQRLILDQIAALTGRRYIGDYRAEDEQFKGLMDNALALAAAFDLRPGIALSADQIATLDQDIVWLVEAVVDGQTVLAPVVYLSKASRAAIESGAVIAATDIDLSLAGDLANKGVIRADRDMRLQAANILNDGGSLKSGGNMTLVARTDITSLAGNIASGGNATLVAGRDIRLASVADTETHGVSVITRVRDQILAAGGDLVMQAGRDLTLTGVAARVGGDAALIAGRDLTLDTVKSVNRQEVTYRGGFASMETIGHTLTTIDVAGSLALRAGSGGTGSGGMGGTGGSPVGFGNLSITSAQLSAGGNLTLAATGNIDISAAKDRVFTDSQVTTKGFMNSRSERNLRDDETLLGATLQSGASIAFSAGSGGSGGTGSLPVGSGGSSGMGDSPMGSAPSSSSNLTSPAASGNISLTSAYLNAAGSVTLAATNDITLNTLDERRDELHYVSVKKTSIGGAFNGMGVVPTVKSSSNATSDAQGSSIAIGTTINGSDIALQAGRNIHATGAGMKAAADIFLAAGNDITLSAATSTYTENHYKETSKSGPAPMLPGGKSTAITHNTLDESLAGATLQAGNNITLVAGNVGSAGVQPADGSATTGNITLASAYLNAGNAVALAATNDITLTTLSERHEAFDEVSTTRRKITYKPLAAAAVSHKTIKTTQTDHSDTDLAVGTVVSADSVAMQAGRDINVHGSQVVADNDISLRAERDLNITAATNTYEDDHHTKQVTTGIVDTNALSVTAGVRIQKKEVENIATEAAGSLIGSTNGVLDLYAGRDATIIGSELWSQKGLTIDAENIGILAAENQYTSTYKETFFQSGVTVAFKSNITDMAMGLYQTAKRGTEVKDDRLKGLYAAKTAYAAYDLYKGIKGTQTDKGAKEQAASMKISISFGANYSENTSTTEITDYIGSTLTTAGDMTLIARGDNAGASLADARSGNINIFGSSLDAQNLALDAANNITIQSAQNTHSLDSENMNIGGAVGVSVGVGKGASGLSFFADVSAGMGNEEGNGTNQYNSYLTATDKLTIKSGNDTTIAGAQLRGDTVVAGIGHDLTIKSLQDTDTYKAKQQQISAGGSGGVGGGEGHMSYSESKTTSDYASVKEQTGIHAGKGGFDINVGNHTSLTGAVIASEAETALNRLTTQTIDFSDIENRSKYDSKSISISVSAGSSGGSVSGGMSHQSDSKTGATRSAIAEGDITVRSDYDEQGNRIADSLAGLSRDTATANDGALENSFNQQKLAEQREMGQVFGEVAFRTAGVVATTIYEQRLSQIKDDYESGRITADEAGRQKSNAYFLYGDGQILNYAMNTIAGAATAEIGGGDALAGAAGAAAATFADPKAVDDFGNLRSPSLTSGLISLAAAIGAGSLAGDGITGGGAGLDATIYNQNLHKQDYAISHKIDQSLPGALAISLPEGKTLTDEQKRLIQDLGAASVAAYHSGSAAPVGLTVVGVYTKKADGTDAVAFQRGTDEIIIAYRGSASLSDWLVTNPVNAIGGEAKKYIAAMELAKKIMKSNPEMTIYATGHSLGGGQAGLAAVQWGLPADAFNAAGVNPENYIKGYKPSVSDVENYRFGSEPLTFFQTSTPLTDALGLQQKLKIKTLPSLYNFFNHGSSSIMRSLGNPDLIKVTPPVKTSGTQSP